MPRPDREALVVLLALALRAAVVLAPGLPEPGLWEDARIALNLAAGRGYREFADGEPTAIKGPPYPLLLAGVARLASGERRFVVAAGLVNALLGAASVALLIRLGARLFSPAAGLAAGLVLACLPTHVYLARIPEASSLTHLLGLAGLRAIVQAGDRRRARDWLVAGALAGLAALSNPVTALALGTAMLLFGRLRLRPLLTAAAAAALVMAPWTLRNHAVFGRPLPVKSAFWLDVYQGLLPDLLDGRQVLPLDLEQRVAAGIAGQDELGREEVFAGELRPWMAENWPTLAGLALWRVGQFWCLYGQRSQLGALPDTLLRVLPEAALLGLALIGTRRAWRRNRRATLAIAAFPVAHTAVYSLIVAANIRYHLEVVWAVALLAAIGLTSGQPIASDCGSDERRRAPGRRHREGCTRRCTESAA